MKSFAYSRETRKNALEKLLQKGYSKNDAKVIIRQFDNEFKIYLEKKIKELNDK